MLLNLQELSVGFPSGKGQYADVVRKIDLQLDRGEVLGVVGESGSGKSVTNLALMGLLPAQARVMWKDAEFDGQKLDLLDQKQLSKIRGRKMSMIFQDPMTSLNPSFTVGFQLCEGLKYHLGMSRHEAEKRSLQLLSQVGISSPEKRMGIYPFELSGGMAQRVMIAMAIACEPQVLIADEPTTALDVTIQKQILDLLRELQQQRKMSVIFVSHDLALVSEIAHRVQVMYAGEVVEVGQTSEVLRHPRHQYTFGLMNARPRPGLEPRAPLANIPGLVPSADKRPQGCQFHPRCQAADRACKESNPVLVQGSHRYACYHPIEEKR